MFPILLLVDTWLPTSTLIGAPAPGALGVISRGGVGVGVPSCGVEAPSGVVSSALLPHPCPPAGTKFTLGSLPLFSAFKLGKFAGGGMRRTDATLPRLCMPCF